MFLRDVRITFCKGPNVSFGLFLPLALYWAFAQDTDMTLAQVIPGLVAVAIFFGAGAIQAISLPLDRRTGTLHTLLAREATLPIVVAGKALTGLVLGLILATAYGLVAMVFLTLRPNVLSFGLASFLSSFCGSPAAFASPHRFATYLSRCPRPRWCDIHGVPLWSLCARSAMDRGPGRSSRAYHPSRILSMRSMRR